MKISLRELSINADYMHVDAVKESGRAGGKIKKSESKGVKSAIHEGG